MNCALTIKKKHTHIHSITFTLDRTCCACFGSGWRVWDPLFRRHIRKSKFHHPWRCSLQSFHQHLHGRHTVCWHQHDCVSDLHSTGAAQIWSKNAVTRGCWKSTLLCYFANAQTTIGTNNVSDVLDIFLIVWCWKLVLNLNCPQLKFGSIYNVCTIDGFVFY